MLFAYCAERPKFERQILSTPFNQDDLQGQGCCMKSRWSLVLASLGMLGLTGCHGALSSFFNGAPCETCAGGPAMTCPAPAPCMGGCPTGPVVSGMMPGEVVSGDYYPGDAAVVAPWGDATYGDSFGGYPSGGIVTSPAPTPVMGNGLNSGTTMGPLQPAAPITPPRQ